MNVLAIEKVETGERYVFLYDDSVSSRTGIYLTLGKFASDPELSFTWHDASILCKKAAQRMRQCEERT